MENTVDDSSIPPSAVRVSFLKNLCAEQFGEFNDDNKSDIKHRCKQPTKMQQLFPLLIFLKQTKMFRATNSPILRSTFDLYTAFGTKHCNDKL